ncbi:MAG: hypothetical protein CfP315_0384 [Candidatus Improbicoccus pseudotrichonymphae]|uniref:HlyD family secretion protein n=1 Tax=Candidatus Improbicoccus pseudotrichonymphae TaxID=3033792 RepID=A0AA48HY46_9FIRM|nr:MAG: hypothetical protein CfP315_0384 [Candidatus Improbicoccus pseudotrichonymphae]
MILGNKEIFRKTSLERISSPEKLNEYIKIINPFFVIVLSVIFFVISIIGFWFFTSSIPKYMDIKGIVEISENYSGEKFEEKKVYSYVSLYTSKQLKVGNKVSVYLEYVPKKESGYINGEIISIGEEIITSPYIYKKFENPNIVESILPKNENFVEIVIKLDGWSNKKSESIKIINGTLCDISVIVSNRKIYEVIGI